MPPPKEERYTFADAMTWPDNLRIELIKGVPVTRTAQVHLLEDGQYHSPVVYTEKANVPTRLWENFSVSLAQVFEGI